MNLEIVALDYFVFSLPLGQIINYFCSNVNNANLKQSRTKRFLFGNCSSRWGFRLLQNIVCFLLLDKWLCCRDQRLSSGELSQQQLPPWLWLACDSEQACRQGKTLSGVIWLYTLSGSCRNCCHSGTWYVRHYVEASLCLCADISVSTTVHDWNFIFMQQASFIE